MTIAEFFDPCNIIHLQAYDHLLRTGSWPEGFFPPNVDMYRSSNNEVNELIARCHVTAFLNGELKYFPKPWNDSWQSKQFDRTKNKYKER
jgi:hypothetical protein